MKFQISNVGAVKGIISGAKFVVHTAYGVVTEKVKEVGAHVNEFASKIDIKDNTPSL